MLPEAQMLPEHLTERIERLEPRLEELLACSPLEIERRNFPDAPGVYRIFECSERGVTVRAGRSISLQQRLYANHLMGDQPGNLPAQLVRGGECADRDAAKRHIRQNLVVQILPVADADQRKWLEHFMLAVLQPRYCD
jgi:hypothetical protein